MIKVSRRIITSICLIGATYASAQTTFYVEGLGRAQIANDQLSGDILATDTVGGIKKVERKNTGGYTLLDLGFNIEKKDKFYLNTILRGRNSFGLFWGEGTTFEFRKITMGGLIGSGIKYEMGDIYLEMSPYTLFLPDADYSKYESQMFGLRRSIVDYENFVNGNKRFQQGLKSEGTLLFTKGIQKLHLAGFAARTSEITQLGSPDVIMAGASAKAVQGKYGSLGLNFISLFDLPVATNVKELNATTFTTSINPSYKLNEKMTFSVDAEIGGSNYSASFSDSVSENIAFSGTMLDAKANVELSNLKTKVSFGFKNVDASFRAPAAQSRRINDYGNANVFGNNSVSTAGALVQRNLMLFDRFTQENIYHQGISNTLQNFNPAFNNVNPYGAATPNRTGLQFGLTRGNQKDAFSLDVNAQMLSEIEGDVTSGGQKRTFTSLASGLLINVSKIAEFKKDLNISIGYQMEQTNRAGNEKVELNSSIIDLSVSGEIVKDVDLMFGMKSYSVKGNEFVGTYQRLNYTRWLFNEVKYDSNELMMSFGGRFRFTDKSAVTLNYSTIARGNALTTAKDDYKWNQLFVNYTMKF
jgi:hypothetical protein